MLRQGEGQFFARDEWLKHGPIILPCLLGMALVALHAYMLGVVLAPIESEFGWSRSQISAGPLVTSIFTLLLSPFGGRAVDRFGPRRMALIGVPVFSLAIAAIALTTSDYLSWLGLYALLAVGLILIYPTVWTAAIAVRFEKNRGIALAIALSGTGLTAAFVPSAAAWLLESYGWRGVYVGLGIFSFVALYPLVLFLFDREDMHRQLDRIEANKPVPGDSIRLFGSSKFLKLAAAGFIYSVGATGLGINAVPVLIEDGFTLVRAAELAGLIGIGTIIGRVGGGVLLDRFDGRFVAAGCGMAAITSVLILLATDQSQIGAAIACMFLGFAAGAEYDACAYLTTRHFARRDFGAVFGVIGGLSGFGSGISPMLANGVYDLTGSYDVLLWGLIPLFVIACLLFLLLGRYPDVEPGVVATSTSDVA